MTDAEYDALVDTERLATISQLEAEVERLRHCIDGYSKQREDRESYIAALRQRHAEAIEAVAEEQFRYGYRLGLSRGSNDETEDGVVLMWKHKRSVESEAKAGGHQHHRACIDGPKGR